MTFPLQGRPKFIGQNHRAPFSNWLFEPDCFVRAVIDPRSKVIMHMYDDRGLDIIAAELNTLRPLFETFGDWILNNQRHRVEFRFKKSIRELPE